MDRKRQLSNVAFGGAWSEQIAGREEIAAAAARVRAAAAAGASQDPRRSSLTAAAVALLCDRHPKGAMLAEAWRRAAGIEAASARVTELGRIAAVLVSGIEAELRR